MRKAIYPYITGLGEILENRHWQVNLGGVGLFGSGAIWIKFVILAIFPGKDLYDIS